MVVYDLEKNKKEREEEDMFILKRLSDLSKRLETTDLFNTLTFAPAKISFLTA